MSVKESFTDDDSDVLFCKSPAVDIHDPQYAQPLTTIAQIALVNLLSHFGLHPSAVVGHSSGEIAAA